MLVNKRPGDQRRHDCFGDDNHFLVVIVVADILIDVYTGFFFVVVFVSVFTSTFVFAALSFTSFAAS